MRCFRLCCCVGTEKEKKNTFRGRRETASCKSYLSILCNAIYPEVIWIFFLHFFLFFDSGASRKYVFGKSQTNEFLSGAAHLHPDVRRNARSYREPFGFCFFFFLPWRGVFFPMYRAVYTTDRDRRPCCGCKCGSVAVVLSADLHVTSDRWTENLRMYRKRRHTAGTWTLEHHRRCPVTNTRLFYYFRPLKLVGFGLTRGHNHWSCTDNPFIENRKEVFQWVDQPKQSVPEPLILPVRLSVVDHKRTLYINIRFSEGFKETATCGFGGVKNKRPFYLLRWHKPTPSFELFSRTSW